MCTISQGIALYNLSQAYLFVLMRFYSDSFIEIFSCQRGAFEQNRFDYQRIMIIYIFDQSIAFDNILDI